MADKPVDAEILTIKEVSEYLKVTERTIYRLAAAKKIPGFKVGGAWRFSKAEIDQWIRRQSEDGESDADLANTEEKMTTEQSGVNEQMEQSLIEMAVESWRFARLFSRVVNKLDAGESSRYVNQLRYFQKSSKRVSMPMGSSW